MTDPAEYGRYWAEYGRYWADIYDQRNPIDGHAEAAADFLHGLAGKEAALEFGVGTGRLALPLAERGTPVHGMDISAAMLDKLGQRMRGQSITVSLGDVTSDRVLGQFALVYLVFNVLFMVGEQASQVRCVRNAAAHLRPGGLLVIEAFVPSFQLAHYTGAQATRTEKILDDEVWLLASRHDSVRQVLTVQSIRMTADGNELRPASARYIWPAELDLMCQLAGFALRSRHGGWRHEPFTATSTHHVSVYELRPPDVTPSGTGGD